MAPLTDTVSVRIEAPADEVFAFMSDPERLDLWSFGTWKITRREDGLIAGQAIQTGARILVRISADPGRRLIDYHLGADPGALRPRIFARIIPGETTGHNAASSTLLLVALRSADMDDARWDRLCHAHAFEADLVKSLIESGYDHRI